MKTFEFYSTNYFRIMTPQLRAAIRKDLRAMYRQHLISIEEYGAAITDLINEPIVDINNLEEYAEPGLWHWNGTSKN